MTGSAALEYSLETGLTCNCLLATRGCGGDGAEHSLAAGPRLVAACYELESTTPAKYVGGVAWYDEEETPTPQPRPRRWEKRMERCDLPGIFDITWASTDAFFSKGESATPGGVGHRLLLATTTDGDVRLLHPATLETIQCFPAIHEEMLTSCTPFLPIMSSSASDGLHLLCTAHSGAVVLYDTVGRTVAAELEGHEFDAWCGAVMPTTASRASAASGGAAQADASPCPAVLLSGGDDALMKLYDMRAGYEACGRASFSAGVVHIAPVVSTAAAQADPLGQPRDVVCSPTPYVLVGSYDESISLVDTRFVKRPVAQRTGLGGGVWRCSRCLFPFVGPLSPPPSPSPDPEGGESAATNYSLLISGMDVAESEIVGGSSSTWRGAASHVVNEANTLLLPLMQRGAALLSYNVLASAEEVFGQPLFLQKRADTSEDGEEGEATLSSTVVSPEALVYDTAVLEVAFDKEANNFHARVATCSFYEKCIDIWLLKGLSR